MLRACLSLCLLLSLSGCSGQECGSSRECPIGTHCRASGGVSLGRCTSDCASAEDCPQDETGLSSAICDNEGRCRLQPRTPRLKVLSPEFDTLLSLGTDRIRIEGEVSAVQSSVRVNAVAKKDRCALSERRSVLVENAEPGTWQTTAFSLEDIALVDGLNEIEVTAEVSGSIKTITHLLEVSCPGCASLELLEPTLPAFAFGLELGRLVAVVEPAVSAPAIWRVHGAGGHVFDGALQGEGGRYSVDRLPLFAGSNIVELQVSGVGDGTARCRTVVVAGTARESGLRAILTWDGPSADLDLVLVGPGGRFLDPATNLGPTLPTPEAYEGEVFDDLMGFGPEVLRVPMPPHGTYGLAVVPSFDGSDFGSSAFVRVLFDGEPVGRGALGPTFVSASLSGDIWLVGTLNMGPAGATWRTVDRVTPPDEIPNAGPELW